VRRSPQENLYQAIANQLSGELLSYYQNQGNSLTDSWNQAQHNVKEIAAAIQSIARERGLSPGQQGNTMATYFLAHYRNRWNQSKNHAASLEYARRETTRFLENPPVEEFPPSPDAVPPDLLMQEESSLHPDASPQDPFNHSTNIQETTQFPDNPSQEEFPTRPNTSPSAPRPNLLDPMRWRVTMTRSLEDRLARVSSKNPELLNQLNDKLPLDGFTSELSRHAYIKALERKLQPYTDPREFNSSGDLYERAKRYSERANTGAFYQRLWNYMEKSLDSNLKPYFQAGTNDMIEIIKNALNEGKESSEDGESS
jgi:hypothetical protein